MLSVDICVYMQFKMSKVKILATIGDWYNEIPYPALKTKREITKYSSLRKACEISKIKR